MTHTDFWKSCSRAAKSSAAKFGFAAVLMTTMLGLPLTGRSSVTRRSAQQKQTGPAPKLPKVKGPAKKNTVATPVEAHSSGPAQMTTADLNAFFDGMMPLQIQQGNIAGAVVAVVKDGQVVFAKGYGYSDLKTKKPVSPDDTLFRVGSVSKLFTWTAVMQLVQDGKINLDTDINQYLDFHVNEPRGKITMRDLMTHTPGFEEAIKDLISDNPAHMSSLGDYLKTHQPQQIFAPFTTGAYSNYGAGLAGYIVQRVSGQPFDDYIEQHIFQPLGMTHASFRQPLPANLAPLMSQGFQVASGGPKPFELVNPAPAGALAVSAMDITHFMIAQLNNGSYSQPGFGINVQMACPNGNCAGVPTPLLVTQILKPETAQEMHSRQYAPDPKVNGMCLGFYEDSRNGHRVIAHGGDTIYFHSDLHLILDANVGLFVSFNSLGREGPPRGPLYHEFMDRYFPYTQPAIPSVATAASDAQAASGTYISSRRPQTNIFYMFAVLGEEKVVPGKDGTLMIVGQKGINGQPTEWHEEAQNVWYDPADPQDKMVFTKNNGLPIIAVEYPFEQSQRVDFLHSKGFVQNGLIFALGILALTLILWPIAALVRWHYGWKTTLGDSERRARAWARLECVVVIFFWACFLGTIVEGSSHLNLLSHSADWWFRIIQLIGWIGVIGTIIAIWNFFVSIGTAGRWWWAKVHDTLILLACLTSVWLIWMLHLLHFSLLY